VSHSGAGRDDREDKAEGDFPRLAVLAVLVEVAVAVAVEAATTPAAVTETTG
jgi:hypothetical protein